MKTVRKNSKYFSFIMGISFLLFSCAKDEINNNNTALSFKDKKTETGEEAFKSIFFGFGELANNITQLIPRNELLNDYTVAEKAEVENKINSLIVEIKKVKPNYFVDLKSTLMSGDYINIKTAIDEGSTLIYEKADVVFPGFNELVSKVQMDLEEDPFLFNDNGSVEDYINDYQGKPSEYDGLLEENMLSNRMAFAWIVWALPAVLYAAFAVHNTIGISALIYYKFGFYGPSISSFSASRNRTGGGSGGSGGGSASPIIADIPDNQAEANLMNEVLIEEIATYYGS